MSASETIDVSEKVGFCTLCRSRCGTLNRVENGRLVSVKALPSHPTGGAICPKGRAAPEIAHSSRRLQKPLRRTRPKTESDPGWREIEWDEALDEIAAQFDKIRRESGPEAVAFAVSSPSGTPMSDSFEWIDRFARVFGTPNHCNATEICNWQKDFAHAFTFGCGMPPGDYRNSDLVVLWGFNPANSWLAVAGASMRWSTPARTGSCPPSGTSAAHHPRPRTRRERPLRPRYVASRRRAASADSGMHRQQQ